MSARAKSARLMTPRLRGSYAAKAARHRSRPSTPGPARLRSVNRSLRYSSVTPREWSVPNEGGRRRLGAAVYGRGWSGRSGAPQGEVPGAAEPGRSRWMPFVRSAPAMGAGLGGALAGTALGTDRGSVVVVGTALLGRSHSSVGRRPREKDMSPAPGARGGGGRCFSRRKCIRGLRSVSPCPTTVSDFRKRLAPLPARTRRSASFPLTEWQRAKIISREKKKTWRSLASEKYARSRERARRFAATRGHRKDSRERRATRSEVSNLRTSHAERARIDSLAHGASRRPVSALSGPHVLARTRLAGNARASRVGVSARDARRDPRAGDAAAERVDDFS